MIGKTLSPYKVIEKIGQGGMGAVYRAEDTSLKREVAIKVLPEQFTQDPQRLHRDCLSRGTSNIVDLQLHSMNNVLLYNIMDLL
ncbi:hypothetical protein MYX82_03385 [Acidobacteria bacterium AH-259-D05]|nr:hypothetical protein [Acidobacteria bacterium AH-259-D05]